MNKPISGRILRGLSIACLFLASCQESKLDTTEVLKFNLTEANVRNYFVRKGTVAGHLLTTSGINPRIVWGFPAENTGIGLWFDPPARSTEISVEDGLQPVSYPTGMWGVTGTVKSDAAQLRLKKGVFGNVRTVRDYFYGATIIPEFDYSLVQTGSTLVMNQQCLDGKHHIRLVLDLLDGTSAGIEGSQLVFHAGGSGIRMRATATIDYTGLTPLDSADLLTSGAADLPTAKNALAFLTYKEKMLAGSWRFLTYFGRDTMLSLRMLMPVLQPDVLEAGLGGVVDRVNEDGVVAHEEALGDYSWFVRTTSKLPAPLPPQDMFSPWLDYKMIDGDFLLPAVLGVYAGTPAGQPRMQAFLARTTPAGETYQAVVKRNIALLLQRTTAFSANPIASNLIAIKHPEVGNWRDSGSGLGGGKYPFDVNVALAPAALRGAAALYAAGALGDDNGSSAKLNAIAAVWEAKALPFFEIQVDQATAQSRVAAYATRVGLAPAPAVASITGPITYRAVSLDASGNPVPVMNTDDGFVMLFTNPSEAFLLEAAGRILRPFPAGLRTDSGVVVANTALADPASPLHATFTRGDYHGTVIWSWQQAMLAAGFERQLKRPDLQPATVTQLKAAQTALWKVIQSSSALSAGELWSWEPDSTGNAKYASFAKAATDLNRFVDESNAIQLWSTVYLAVRPPSP